MLCGDGGRGEHAAALRDDGAGLGGGSGRLDGAAAMRHHGGRKDGTGGVEVRMGERVKVRLGMKGKIGRVLREQGSGAGPVNRD